MLFFQAMEATFNFYIRISVLTEQAFEPQDLISFGEENLQSYVGILGTVIFKIKKVPTEIYSYRARYECQITLRSLSISSDTLNQQGKTIIHFMIGKYKEHKDLRFTTEGLIPKR